MKKYVPDLKVLVVSPTPFAPPAAGNRRLLRNRLEQMRSVGWEVDFVYLDFEHVPEAPVDLELVRNSYRVPFTWPINPNPVLTDIDWLARGIRLPDEVTAKYYDLLIVNYVFCTFAVSQVSAGFVALETHDRFANRHELLMSNDMSPTWISATVTAEARAVSRADAVAILREDDRAYYESLSDARVLLLRHSEMQRAPWPKESDLTHPLRFGFVASSNVVNQKALMSLLEAMRRRPEQTRDLRVRVFGDICRDVPQDYRDLCVLLGHIKDDADLYRGFDVLVNPVFAGTGMKIKSVEAMAYGKPVLSGAEGAAGFPVVPSQMALASPDAIIDRMLDVTHSAGARAAMLADAEAAFTSYVMAAQADFTAFAALLTEGSAERLRVENPPAIRWITTASSDAAEGLPERSVWDLLRRSADRRADFVATETLALQPLAWDAYLPAAVAAVMNGDTERGQRLFQVYLAGAPVKPNLPEFAPDISARLMTTAVATGDAVTSAAQRAVRERLADYLAGKLDIAEMLLAADLVMEPVLPEPVAETSDAVDLPISPLPWPRRTAMPESPMVMPPPFASPLVLPEVSVTVTLHPTDDPERFLRIDYAIRGYIRKDGETVPLIFLKMLHADGAWLAEVHPNDSPEAFVSPPDAWDQGSWGPSLKVSLGEDTLQSLGRRLVALDVDTVWSGLTLLRDHLVGRNLPVGSMLDRLRNLLIAQVFSANPQNGAQ